ncbi:MAG: hypothetical protein MZW92_27455, partial [Comamonadaceae bacterium]|nr:hypothetical protein [Comamonadaceae bacterium]
VCFVRLLKRWGSWSKRNRQHLLPRQVPAPTRKWRRCGPWRWRRRAAPIEHGWPVRPGMTAMTAQGTEKGRQGATAPPCAVASTA